MKAAPSGLPTVPSLPTASGAVGPGSPAAVTVAAPDKPSPRGAAAAVLAIAMTALAGAAMFAPLAGGWRGALWGVVSAAWMGMAVLAQRALQQRDAFARAHQRFAAGERRWLARAQMSGEWSWETDAEHRISWLSEDLASHLKLGLDPRPLLGLTLDGVPHFLPPEGGWPTVQRLLQQGAAFHELVLEVRRPGRSAVWVALSGRPRAGSDGGFVGYEGIGRDVTEQRLAVRRLRASERHRAVLAELSADWYWATDVQDRFTELGTTLAALLGEEGGGPLLGQLGWQAMAVESPDRHRLRADLRARRAFSDIECVLQRAGRPVRWIAVSGRPRHDERGRCLGYHGVARDVTLRRRAERLLRTRNAELEREVAQRTAKLAQHNRDLEAFARQLAHELRTPIGHLIGLGDLVRSRAWARLDDDARQLVELQSQAARTMSDTVSALLELARSGSAPLVRQTVDLSVLAAAVIDELPRIDRRAPVGWSIEPGLRAHGSAALLRVVLMNLLGNAAKFTRGVAAPRVRLGAAGPTGGFVVEDNGVGFDPARAGRLFQPFQRLHAAEQFHGTGLGLSIVRRIVERHGGDIRADSRPGDGARFVFHLGASAGETTDDVAENPT